MKDAFSANEPTLIDCRPAYTSPPGFSFFFDLIRKECNGLSPAPLHRVCSLMRKMGVQCLTREELKANPEIEEEHNAALIRTAGSVNLKALRLTFFRDFPRSKGWRGLAGKEALGYAVLLGLTLPDGSNKCYILEAVVRIPTLWVPDASGSLRGEPITNYYVHCCREFEKVVG